MSQRAWIRFGISAALLFLFLLQTRGVFGYNLLDKIEAASYDARLLLTLPNTVDPRIVIVDIDEKTLAAEGWPIPRAKMGRLVQQLFDTYHVRALGFDEVFSEPDAASGLKMLDELARGELADVPGFAQRIAGMRDQLDGDRVFAQMLAGRAVVLGSFFKKSVARDEAPLTGKLCAPLLDAAELRLMQVDFPRAGGAGGSLAVLQDAVPACGFFDNPVVDEDGVYRRVPLIQLYQDQAYPSLALSLAQLALGRPPISLEFDPPEMKNSLHLERVRVGQASAPVDGQAAVYVPYRGRQGSFPYISLTDVLRGHADADKLRDAIVLVGTTAAGLLDLRSTPVAKVYAGVEVHANVISGLLDGRIRQKAPYYSGVEGVLLALIAGLMAALFPRLSPILGAVLVAAILVALVLIGFAAWSGNFITPLGIPLVFTLALFLAQLLYGYFIESRGKRDLARRFGEYVPPERVAEMAENPRAVMDGAQRRDMTVLFSDVRGFTTISEKFRDDPQGLSSLMNEFLSPLTEVVFNHRGTIDKYMGDAIMAFWGAPLEDKDHALHGLQAAREFNAAVRRLDPAFEARGWPKLQIGVGLNSGPMSVGDMGSKIRKAYTVLGDAVNQGSRFEGLTKEYGVQVICGEATRQGAPDWVFRELDLVRVKGKDEPVAIYEPLGPREAVPEEVRKDLSRHRQALRAYRAQKWDEAESEFFGLSRSGRPHAVYELYLERIAYFRSHPPGEAWDGAFTFKTK